MSVHDQEHTTLHEWRMHTGAGRLSRQLREKPERRWPFLTWPFFLAQLLIAKEVLAGTLDRQDDPSSDDTKQGLPASPDIGADGADAAAMHAGSASDAGASDDAPLNASFLVANSDSQSTGTKAVTPADQSGDASARNQSDSPASFASGGALAVGSDGSSDKDSSSGDSGHGCCEPNAACDTGCSPTPAHPIGSGGLLPSMGVELSPNIGIDLPPVLGVELPPVIAINLPPDLNIDIALGGNPTGAGTALLPYFGLELGDSSLGVSVATPILDADIGLNLGLNDGLSLGLDIGLGAPGGLGTTIPNSLALDQVGELVSAGVSNGLALDVHVGGEPLLQTLGVGELTDLLGPTAGGFDPNVAISALQDIGLQAGAALTGIGLPAPVETVQTLGSSGASLVADAVDFASLQIGGMLPAGGNLGFADMPPSAGPQVNELFNGAIYTDYNIALQSVDIGTTQPLLQTPLAAVETVLDPLAPHEVASQSDGGASSPAHLDVAHLPITVSLDELSIRAISI